MNLMNLLVEPHPDPDRLLGVIGRRRADFPRFRDVWADVHRPDGAGPAVPVIRVVARCGGHGDFDPQSCARWSQLAGIATDPLDPSYLTWTFWLDGDQLELLGDEAPAAPVPSRLELLRSAVGRMAAHVGGDAEERLSRGLTRAERDACLKGYPGMAIVDDDAWGTDRERSGPSQGPTYGISQLVALGELPLAPGEMPSRSQRMRMNARHRQRRAARGLRS